MCGDLCVSLFLIPFSACAFATRKPTSKLDEKLRSIKIIMANILPTHVAQVYKVRRPHDQLYYENFSKVAVMFASIENFNADTAGLRILHEIICCFDDLLVDYQTRYKIEKIKVMGWTYMVACGLETDHYTDFSIDIPVKQPEADSEIRRGSSGDYFPRLD